MPFEIKATADSAACEPLEYKRLGSDCTSVHGTQFPTLQRIESAAIYRGDLGEAGSKAGLETGTL